MEEMTRQRNEIWEEEKALLQQIIAEKLEWLEILQRSGEIKAEIKKYILGMMEEIENIYKILEENKLCRVNRKT